MPRDNRMQRTALRAAADVERSTARCDMVPHPEANILVTSAMEAAAGALSVIADGVNGADLYGIDDSSIAALQYALFGQEYEAGSVDPLVLGTHELVYTYNDLHGGWLFRFPDDNVAALAQLRGEGLVRVARDWSKIFENNGSPPARAQVEEMLRQLVALAQNAVRWGRPMYWLAPGC
jgi:hypothetical protein